MNAQQRAVTSISLAYWLGVIFSSENQNRCFQRLLHQHQLLLYRKVHEVGYRLELMVFIQHSGSCANRDIIHEPKIESTLEPNGHCE